MLTNYIKQTRILENEQDKILCDFESPNLSQKSRFSDHWEKIKENKKKLDKYQDLAREREKSETGMWQSYQL